MKKRSLFNIVYIVKLGWLIFLFSVALWWQGLESLVSNLREEMLQTRTERDHYEVGYLRSTHVSCSVCYPQTWLICNFMTRSGA